MSFKSVGIIFFSYAYIAFVGLSSVIMFPIACLVRLLTQFFDKRLILLNLFSSFWACLYIWCVPIWSVKITGRQKMDMKKSYVIVSNHQSQLDILMAYRLFFPFRWISKAEVFNLPFIGWNMVLNGHVKLKRGDKESIQQMMDQCEQLLKQNISIMLFPEGTRSKTAIVKPFKPGAFILAKKTKKSIIPLVINNTRNALPKYSLRLQGQCEIEVRVLDEIPFSIFEHMEIDDIASMVQKMISTHVKEHIILKQRKYTDRLTGC
jgi:1-acyl-sn-glycerol-3-phosphate acyltransferase